MMFWLIALALSLACCLAILWVRRANGTDLDVQRDVSSLEIYKDQLAEVDRDLARGVISKAEGDAAKLEIKRRILSLSDGATATQNTTTASSGFSGKAIVGAALFVPLMGVGLYAFLGSPQTPSAPFAQRIQEPQENDNIEKLAQKLFDTLNNDPDGGASEGWVLLGRTYMGMNRFSDAALAFGVVAARQDDVNADILSRLGEALIGAENGRVSAQAQRQFDRALSMEPKNVMAIYYTALGLEQNGDAAKAHDLLVERLNADQEDGPWREGFIDYANKLAGELGRSLMQPAELRGPTQAEIDAAHEMSAQDRMQMIQGMVDGLAERLKENPDDLDGWLRLAKAYQVLKQRERARDAFENAAKLVDDLDAQDPRRQVIQDGLAQ